MDMALVGPDPPSLACQDLLNTPKSFRWGLELIIQIFLHECQNTRANVSRQMSKHCMRVCATYSHGWYQKLLFMYLFAYSLQLCAFFFLWAIFACFHLIYVTIKVASLSLSLFLCWPGHDGGTEASNKNKITEDGCRVRILKSADERK